MTNAEKFRKIFKEFATEVWAFSEKDFLTWLNADYEESTIRNCFGCKYSKDNHNSGTEECHLCMWENQYTPTTKNDLGVDCIKKSDAINIIQDMHGLARADVISDAVNRIIELPSVTPQEPRKGHWITHPNGIYAHLVCDKCLSSAPYDCKTNFCPNCGADMREVKE